MEDSWLSGQTEDVWYKEAFAECNRRAAELDIDPMDHDIGLLSVANTFDMPYHFADQVWQIGKVNREYGLIPILH